MSSCRIWSISVLDHQPLPGPLMPELDRRLVAVMFTDMVGYTALIQADELGAVAK